MRFLSAAAILAAFLISGCSGGSLAPPRPGAAFSLAPASIDLTPGSPSDTINGQGDIAGVRYTPHAASDCATPAGAIAVGGDGIAQTDVAGAPLLFAVYSAGVTPPASCIVTVDGSDGSSASVAVTYSVPVISNVPTARHRMTAAPGATPATLTFSSLASVQELAVTGFSGTTTATVACHASDAGVQITPKQMTGSGIFTVAPYGQGNVITSCTISISDTNHDNTHVAVAVTIGALSKFTATPKSAQFACVASTPLQNCITLRAVTLTEAGQHTFSIVTRPTVPGSCANAFNGPLTMTTDGTTYSPSVSGPSASVTFSGLLPTATLGCSAIVLTDGESPAQRMRVAVDPTLGTAPASLAAASPPPCTGTDMRVNAPNAPHGMYVWNPYKVKGGIYETYMENRVIGKDPNLCGVSLLVSWADVEKTKGTFDWSTITSQAKPYVNAGLTVNLLFADASEVGSNTATPTWVTTPVSQGGDGVATVTCSGQPVYPNFMDPIFETDWENVISHAVAQYGSDPSIGYMRFAIGFGVEALPGHLGTWPTDPCSKAWLAVGYSFDNWVTHSKNIVAFLGRQQTSKQLMVALNYIPGWTDTLYDYPNAVADAAAPRGIAFGTENLGIGHIADPGSTPGACNPQAKNAGVYWCQAFTRHEGKVPFEFQPIEAVADPVAGYNIDFTNLLQYALDNNTQIFELYPQDWLQADAPEVAGFTAANKAKWQAAFDATALVVGAHKL